MMRIIARGRTFDRNTRYVLYADGIIACISNDQAIENTFYKSGFSWSRHYTGRDK